MMEHECVFCDIIAGKAPASIVYEDDISIAFMDIFPLREGQCLVIPKEHIDHFTDLSDEVSTKLMLVAQKLGRKMLQVLEPKPLRIGYVVHGFSVAHAHLNIVPQHEENDITSMRILKIEDEKIAINKEHFNPVERPVLDEMAAKLKITKE